MLWLKAANIAWKYAPPNVRAAFERAAKAANYQNPRDIFFSVMSGNFFLEIKTTDGLTIRPAWLKKYLR
ncbi:MAG: hypothetical protein QW795_08445 [Candidatus Bathyarchaeia archaeon]